MAFITLDNLKTSLSIVVDKLNAKADSSALQQHTEQETLHVTKEEKQIWSNKAGKIVTSDNTQTFNEIFNDYTNNIASGDYSHAEGSKTKASGYTSHAEGYQTKATGDYSHAEGYYTTASGLYSHAEGDSTKATGHRSHAEGCSTKASGMYSHAEGDGTKASSIHQHVQGKHNIEDANNKYAHIVGNGNINKRSNAHTLDWNGNAWFAGKVYVGGTSQDDAVELTNVTVDDVLSDDSINPVQNKIIKAALDTLSAAGVVVDSTLSTESINPVQNKVITEAINGVNTSLETHTSDSNIHVTVQDKENWNNKSNFSGKYTDLTDIPTDLASTTYVDNKIADATSNIDLSNYYTKSDIDSMEFISIADIDEICGANIVLGNEVTY